jgi:hypothetical protein
MDQTLFSDIETRRNPMVVTGCPSAAVRVALLGAGLLG